MRYKPDYKRPGLRDVYVIGIGQTKFGRQPQVPAEQLGVIAAKAAIEDAGVDAGMKVNVGRAAVDVRISVPLFTQRKG